MGKALLIAAAAAFMLGQNEEGVVTSTDLIAPDVSASERDGQAPVQQPENAAPPGAQEEVPEPPDAAVEPVQDKPKATEESAVSDEERPTPREVTSEEARRHKAVAAFWFILPEN
jgi:hypothetical protein